MSSVKLNEVQVDEVCSLAKEDRLALGFAGKTSITNDIILDIPNIILVVVAYIDILVDHSIFYFKTKDAFCDASTSFMHHRMHLFMLFLALNK